MDNKVVRRRQRLFRYAVDIFISLLEQVTKRKRVNYKCNDADSVCWNVFMDTFGDSIGEDFIRKFAEYGFQSWFNSGSERDYSKDIRFNWVFGKRAIDRWKKLDVKTNIYLTQVGLKKTYKINTLRKKTSVPSLITSLRVSEEKFKSDFHNTKRGFIWCVANTTLYFHKSAKCATCNYKAECKEVLKNEYPKIYIERGYGK